MDGVTSTELISRLEGGLVVSCQAPVNSPLHHPNIISAIADASVRRGAVGVRIDTPEHVKAVRQQVDVPIIGLWKQVIPGYEVYITPQAFHADAIAKAGADIIAIDATLRPRPHGETVRSLIQHIHQTQQCPVMADVDTLEGAIAAVEAGADLVGTTLYGYTAETNQHTPPGFSLLQDLVRYLPVPVICEGGIASPDMAKHALTLGAHCVVVGTAITGIDALVSAYCSALSS